MVRFIVISFVAYFWTISAKADGYDSTHEIRFSFLGKEYIIKTQEPPKAFPNNDNNANSFSKTIRLLDTHYADIIPELSTIRSSLHLSDWHYYQLIRKVSQQLIAKENDYWGYTYCKWFFLAKSGFNPLLCTIDDKLLLYVKSNSTIYNIPIKMMDGKQYVCMNYHDYNYDIPIEKNNSTTHSIILH